MRILFFTPRFHTNIFYVVNTFIQNADEVKLITLYKGASEDHTFIKPEIAPLSRLFLHFLRLTNDHMNILRKYSFPPFLRFFKYVKEFNPDIIIIREIRYSYSFIVAVCGRILSKKIIIYRQFPLNHDPRFIKDLFYKIIYRTFNARGWTVVEGNPLKKNPLKGYNKYIPLIIDNPSSDYKPQKLTSKISILCISKFQERKNIVLLIRVFNELRKKYETQLTIIGECLSKNQMEYYKKVIDEIEKLNLQDDIEIKLNMKFKEVLKEYARFQLFVLASSHEQFGFSVLEAMSRGLAVICSDSAGVKYYIEEKMNGFVFKSDNFEDLLEKMESAVKDKSKLLKMGENSFYIVKEKYNGNEFYKKFVDLINY